MQKGKTEENVQQATGWGQLVVARNEIGSALHVVSTSVTIEVIAPRKAAGTQVTNVTMPLLVVDRHVPLHVPLL